MKRIQFFLIIGFLLQPICAENNVSFLTEKIVPFPLVTRVTGDKVNELEISEFLSLSEKRDGIVFTEEPTSVAIVSDINDIDYYGYRFSNYTIYFPLTRFKHLDEKNSTELFYIFLNAESDPILTFLLTTKEISHMQQFRQLKNSINMSIYFADDYYVQAPFDGRVEMSIEEGLFDSSYYKIGIHQNGLSFYYSRVPLTINENIGFIKQGDELGQYKKAETSLNLFDLTIYDSGRCEYVKPTIIYLVKN